jgi:hypothetical protein
MSAENPDAPPTKVVDEEEDEAKEPEQPFKFYLKPEVTYKIISTRWGLFTALGGFCYCYHFTWTVAGVDNYCDTTRTYQCIKDIDEGEPSSDIYDLGIALVTVFHMIEWLR